MPMPDEARTQDAAGAEAFVRYYIELINRASKVMDASSLRDLSSGECRECLRIAANIDEDAQLGHRFQGGELAINELTPPLVKESMAEMAITVDQAALTVFDPTGNPLPDLSSAAYPGLSGGAALEWQPTSQSWLMTALTLE
jgi:hypothetical protein